MKERILPAVIIAVGLMVGGFLVGGRYTMIQDADFVVWRLDRLTGKIWLCGAEENDGALGCGPLADDARGVAPVRD